MMTEPTQVAGIEFPAGLPGFPDVRGFKLDPWGGIENSPFWLMESTDDPDLAFVVCVPWQFYPDYDFNLDDSIAQRLDIRSPADVMVLAIVTVGERPEESTINLLGPIVVNKQNGMAMQAVLGESTYEVRTPLMASAA